MLYTLSVLLFTAVKPKYYPRAPLCCPSSEDLGDADVCTSSDESEQGPRASSHAHYPHGCRCATVSIHPFAHSTLSLRWRTHALNLTYTHLHLTPILILNGTVTPISAPSFFLNATVASAFTYCPPPPPIQNQQMLRMSRPRVQRMR